MEQVGGNRWLAATSPPSFSFLTYNAAGGLEDPVVVVGVETA